MSVKPGQAQFLWPGFTKKTLTDRLETCLRGPSLSGIESPKAFLG